MTFSVILRGVVPVGSKAQALGKAGPGYFKCMPGSRANFVEVDLFKYVPLHKEQQLSLAQKHIFSCSGLSDLQGYGRFSAPSLRQKQNCALRTGLSYNDQKRTTLFP